MNSTKRRNQVITPSDATTIRRQLTTLGIPQWGLAHALGISQGSLSQWLRGLAPIPEGMAERIHNTLDQMAEEKQVAAAAVERLRMERTVQQTSPEERILCLAEVIKQVNLSRATIYKMIRRGEFPRPLQIGQRSVGWPTNEISDWLHSRPHTTPRTGPGAKK